MRVNKRQINETLKEGGCILFDHIDVKAYLVDNNGLKKGTINFDTYLDMDLALVKRGYLKDYFILNTCSIIKSDYIKQ